MNRLFPLLLATLLSPSAFAAADRPNILFIMSDDHTTQAVGAYGSRLAVLNPTPVIDSLAKEGALFTRCFVANSICTPSRATIMTGQYSHVNKVYDLRGRLKPENQYLAIEMKQAGYQTAMIGKWHLEEEPAPFDYYKVLPGQGKYHDPDFIVRGEKPWPKNLVPHKGQHSSDAITDISLEWLKSGWDRSKPFFLMHHYKAPHDMFENAERYESYLADVKIPEPDTMRSFPGQFGSIATRGANDELLPHIGTSIGRRNPRRNYTQLWATDPTLSDYSAQQEAYQTYLKKYLRCVKGVDDGLGRLFAWLKEQNLFDNTVIFYTGDQGFMLGEHDYMDKRWMYEESLRTPLLVRYPKTIPSGVKREAVVGNVDYAATMLDFAGVKTPARMQGRSFRQIAETGKEPADWKQAEYYRYWMHLAHHDNPAHFGIRTKDHKLIFYYGCDPEGKDQTPPAWELYDLAKDPHETRNVYDDPAYAALVPKLKQQLADLRTKLGDTDKEFPAIKQIVDEFWDYDAADRKRAEEISHAYLASKLKPAPQGKKK